MVLKTCKPHTSPSGQFADRFDNLSCVYISEWEYTFQVIYILEDIRRLFTSIGSVDNVVEQSFA